MRIEKKYLSQAKSLSLLGAPLVIGQVAQMSIGVTDSVMLGWYSVDALAAGVMGHTFFFLLFIVGLGFAHAVMPIVASALTQKNTDQIRRITRMALWLSMAYAALLLPMFLSSERVLLALGQSEELSKATSGYAIVIGFSLFPALAAVSW